MTVELTSAVKSYKPQDIFPQVRDLS